MLLTTTSTIEGRAIQEYKGIVFGEVVAGYEEELIGAREEALAELERRAAALGANAVVGVDVDYEVLGSNNGMLMVSASGTAVVI